MDESNIVTIACSSISAIAMIVLVFVTCIYVRHTRKLVEETKIARRDDPELKVYIHDPSDYEWKKMEITSVPTSNYLRIKAILVNPGLVPIVITDIREIVEDEMGRSVITSDGLIAPQYLRPEEYSIYIFGLSWVITSDYFSIWCKTFELPNTENTMKKKGYIYKIIIDYEVGEKLKSATTSMRLSVHEGSSITLS